MRIDEKEEMQRDAKMNVNASNKKMKIKRMQTEQRVKRRYPRPENTLQPK